MLQRMKSRSLQNNPQYWVTFLQIYMLSKIFPFQFFVDKNAQLPSSSSSIYVLSWYVHAKTSWLVFFFFFGENNKYSVFERLIVNLIANSHQLIISIFLIIVSLSFCRFLSLISSTVSATKSLTSNSRDFEKIVDA